MKGFVQKMNERILVQMGFLCPRVCQEFGTRKKVEVLVLDLQGRQIIDDILKKSTD
jgi:hypothetical protein